MFIKLERNVIGFPGIFFCALGEIGVKKLFGKTLTFDCNLNYSLRLGGKKDVKFKGLSI